MTTTIVRVDLRAAAEYAKARGISVLTAVDELLRVLSEARESPNEPGRYRYRNRADHLDITARVVNGCVVAVTVRSYNPPRGGRNN